MKALTADMHMVLSLNAIFSGNDELQIGATHLPAISQRDEAVKQIARLRLVK
jgi:hypothetical protein